MSLIPRISSILLFSFLSSYVFAQEQFILVQSTTSTENSGLYDYILPLYKKESGVEVRVVAVGTGQAITNARRGDADVLLVHSKPDEQQFVKDGFGIERFDLMYNDFVIVGPEQDPASVAAARIATNALKQIASTKAKFVSRADDSGTHKKELSLWQETGIDVNQYNGDWYLETGSGMGATLRTAVAMQAYTLTDRGTWISFGHKDNFRILLEGDPTLFNQYGIIIVNPEKHPHVKYDLAKHFVDWLLSETGQNAIAGFRINDQQLFYPNASN